MFGWFGGFPWKIADVITSECSDHVIRFCGALRDLVPCAQFKKREKHPCRSLTFSEVAG